MGDKKDDIKLKIKKIAIGLRHQRTFGIPELTGSMTDYILHDKKSPFGSDFFDRTDSILEFGENKGRILFKAESDNSLLVDIDNVILTVATDDIESTLKDMKDKYIPYITKYIHKKIEIENFNRLGIVYEYDITGKADHLISRLTNGTFTNAQTGIFKFSSKQADEKSMVMRKLLDYKNYLIAVAFNEEALQAKFDYQFHFQPEIKSAEDIDFNRFIDESKNKLETKFLKWLDNEKKR